MAGVTTRIAGAVVQAKGLNASMGEIVYIGEQQLIGEIVKIVGDKVEIQLYEDATGLGTGEKVIASGKPLSVELGPGLIGSIFDGIQRPLSAVSGNFVEKGVKAKALDRKKKWKFNAIAKKGDSVQSGDVLGSVKESTLVEHKIMVPLGMQGTLKKLESGMFTVEETIAVIESDGMQSNVSLMQWQPVHQPRAFNHRERHNKPLLTGQRVVDTFFPVVKGGVVGLPGGFGTGKTVLGQSLAKYSDADVIVYVGCGERGNEMADLLQKFRELKDPNTGVPLLERTVLIANTSNMPVAARESSIFCGITMAEYYRDMGYDVLLVADSTSRWAEAMREISSRLEEIPGEQGFPPYLNSRMAGFYERAGIVECNGSPKRLGSVSVIGAISPPGGDFSEPVTQSTIQIVKAVWALDAQLAYARHYPAIQWLESYSAYVPTLESWWNENVSGNWLAARQRALSLLQQEDELKRLIQVVGVGALSEEEKMRLEAAKMLREFFLRQNVFDPVDFKCSPSKQFKMLELLLLFIEEGLNAINQWNVSAEKVRSLPVYQQLAFMNRVPEKEFEEKSMDWEAQISAEIQGLKS